MEGLKILIMIFGILFLFEKKPMNIIFNFIGLVITVAILIGIEKAEYISYLLIIIYCSALTIIFGFVIMLTPPLDKINLNPPFFLLPFVLLLSYFGLNRPEVTIKIEPIEKLIINNNELINKIGLLLYLDPTNIFKFLVATLILFLALVALFFILLATV